jgi:hypothetical protein
MDTLTLYLSLLAIVQSVVTLAVAWVIVAKISAFASRVDDQIARQRQYVEDCELTRTRYLVEVQASR